MLNWPIKKIIYLILGFIAIAAIIFFTFFYKATLIIKPDPAFARIEAAGINTTGEVKLKLKPGNYLVKISSSGYISYEKTIRLKMGQVLTLSTQLRLTPGLQKITEEKIAFLASSADNQSLFYLGNKGKTIYKADKIDQKTPEITAITPDVFSDLTDLVFSPNRQIAVFKKGSQTFLYDFKRYDLLHQEIQDWGDGFGEVVWTPDGEKVVYYYGKGETTLIRANRDNTEQERIYNFKDTEIRNPQLRFSADGKKILMITKKIYLFDLYTKTLKEIPEAGEVDDANFTLDSQKIIYEKVASLALIDLEGKNQEDLEVKTKLDKLTWLDNDHFIYAQSQSGSSDIFLKYHLKTKEKIEYTYQPSEMVQATSLISSADKNKLFFISNDYLYGMNLAEREY